MKRVITILYIFAIITTMATGCETVKGVGKDVEKAGQAIKRSVS